MKRNTLSRTQLITKLENQSEELSRLNARIQMQEDELKLIRAYRDAREAKVRNETHNGRYLEESDIEYLQILGSHGNRIVNPPWFNHMACLIKHTLQKLMELTSIVDKLDKTADGVAVKSGMKVYHPYQDGTTIQVSELVPRILFYGSDGVSCVKAIDCYSTHEAAHHSMQEQTSEGGVNTLQEPDTLEAGL